MRFCATLFELLPTDSSLKNSLKKKKNTSPTDFRLETLYVFCLQQHISVKRLYRYILKI